MLSGTLNCQTVINSQCVFEIRYRKLMPVVGGVVGLLPTPPGIFVAVRDS